MDRIVVGMTGASGQRYGISALELLGETDHEVHLVISEAANININQESEYTLSEVKDLADVVHDNRNIGAPPASGSFETRGMLVAPCSMKSLSNISHGNSGNLLTRAADVTLKERRPLVVMPREKPLNRVHIENMLAVTDAGGIVVPPVPNFESATDSIEAVIEDAVYKALGFLVDRESLPTRER
jgi:4-hydroxy-3-polyprenylbenzoate decarboxylase